MTVATKKGVMASKIDALIDQGRTQATQVLERLQNDEISDAVVPIGPDAGRSRPQVIFDGDNVGIEYQGETRQFHPHAATQFGTRLGIPSAWLRNSLSGESWRRELIADVMATTLARTEDRQRLLLRSVANQVRGVLSDQYRRLDSPMIAAGFAKACQALGAVPYRARASAINWSVSAMLPRAIEIELPNHGTEVVTAAVHLRSSDYGAGPLELSFEVLRVLCANGLIGKSVMRQVHLGRRLPDELALSDRTYRLDSETQASTVRDITGKLLSDDYIRSQAHQIRDAAANQIDAEKEVEGLVRAKRITKGEAHEVERVLMRNDEAEIPAGPATRWKLAQALSWVSKTQEDRGHELERLAGGMVLEVTP